MGRDAVFDVSETLLTHGPDDPVIDVALASDPSVRTTGKIRDIRPSADPATRTYRVRVELAAVPAAMMMGATVTGKLTMPARTLARLPAGSVTSVDGKPAVYVVDPASSVVERRAVSIAAQDATNILVRDGVAAGDVVVTTGVSKLRPGQIVRSGEQQ